MCDKSSVMRADIVDILFTEINYVCTHEEMQHKWLKRLGVH